MQQPTAFFWCPLDGRVASRAGALSFARSTGRCTGWAGKPIVVAIPNHLWHTLVFPIVLQLSVAVFVHTPLA
eukprot:15442840-Alexandrium_andersonii.AAC.1